MNSRGWKAAFALWIATASLPVPAADLVVWNPNSLEERTAFDRLVAAYNASQGTAGTHVITVTVPFDGLADKVATVIPRGQGPDIFIFPQDRLGGWVEAGDVVEPLPKLDEATRQRFMPAALQAMTYQRQVYGLPLSFKLITLIYNKKLVRHPPRTTTELKAIAKRLTNRRAGLYGLAYPYDNYYYHAALQNGFGGHVLDGRLWPALDGAENVRALQLLLDWKSMFLPEESFTSERLTALFSAGKIAMMFEGPWVCGQISRMVDYGLAPLPAISEARGRPMKPWMTVDGLYVSAHSRHKEAAFDFLQYVTTARAAKVMALEGGQMPANQKVYVDPEMMADVRVTAFFTQVRSAVPMPNYAEMNAIWGPATSALGRTLRREASPQSALSTAQEQAEKSLVTLQRPRSPRAP